MLRVKPFVWEGVKAIANLWLFLSLQKNGSHAESALAGVGIAEAVKSMLATLVKLDENKGELCTYNALLTSTDRVRTGIGIFPEQSALITSHHELRRSCTVTTCCFHQQGCQLQGGQLQDIIHTLLDKQVFEKRSGERLWVTL